MTKGQMVDARDLGWRGGGGNIMSVPRGYNEAFLADLDPKKFNTNMTRDVFFMMLHDFNHDDPWLKEGRAPIFDWEEAKKCTV
jgi:hypothetical protein